MKKIIQYKNISRFLVFAISIFSATSVFAQAVQVDCNGQAQLQDLHVFFSCWVIYQMQKYVPVLILVALVFFLSGVVKYARAGDNEESRQSGRQIMIYGILILFVMVSVWGAVGLIYNTFFPGIPMTLPDKLPDLQPM